MTFKTICLSLIGLAVVFYISYYRYGIRNWFYQLWYGEEKYEMIKIVRYPQFYIGNWEKELQDAIEYLFKCKYSFTKKEKENYFKLLASVDFNKYPELANLKIMECPSCKKTVVIKFGYSYSFNNFGSCPNCRDITYCIG